MSPLRELRLASEDETLAAGGRIAAALDGAVGPVVILLAGDLGAGKTTFVRGLLRALGVSGSIRSPSYTLVEEHAAGRWEALHLDLYRLETRDALEELGLRERHRPGTLMLVEWPERARPGELPQADLTLSLSLTADAHVLRPQAATLLGDALLHALLPALPDESRLSS